MSIIIQNNCYNNNKKKQDGIKTKYTFVNLSKITLKKF